MANLSITSRCNRHCSYCFAQGSMRDPVIGGAAMGLDVYERALDFLQRSGVDEVRLLGGEPTLHPLFVRLVDAALERAMRVSVFTGGLIPRKALEHLARIDSARLTALVNVLHPASARASELRRQTLVFEALAERVVLGVNIAGPGVDAAFLFDLVDRHALRRCIRIGLAHPAVDGGNRPLNLRHYALVGRQAALVAELARQRSVAIDWDCGWVPCMFPASAQDMLKGQFDQIGVRCNPILDILPDGRVIPCFPLGSVLDDRLSDGIDAATLRALHAAHAALRCRRPVSPLRRLPVAGRRPLHGRMQGRGAVAPGSRRHDGRPAPGRDRRRAAHVGGLRVNMRRIHARLPVYRVETAGRTLLYAPGRALAMKAADADALQRAFEGGCFAMAGNLSLAAAVLEDAAQAALRKRQAQLDAPIAPLCLTVLVSNRCNLACTYCYSAVEREPRRRAIGIPIVSGAAREVVDVGLVERAAHVVAGHCARAERPLTVVFHGGGEPTLQGEQLQQLVACTQRVAVDAGIRWWGYIATNGAMSERRAQWLASTFDRIGLSCDGTPALHDQQRPTRSGGGSWMQVCRTGQALRRAGADFDLRVTVTCKGIAPLPATVRHLFEAFGARLLRVEPVYSSDGSAAPTLDADDAAAFVEAFLSAREWAREHGGDVELSGARPQEVHGPYCNPLRDVLQITPDGIASACFASSSRAVAERRGHVVGTLPSGTDAIVWDRHAIERGRRNAAALASRCDDCVNAMHCVRDCPTICHFQPQGAPGQQDDSFRCRVWKACSIDWMLRHAVSVEGLSSPVPASAGSGNPS